MEIEGEGGGEPASVHIQSNRHPSLPPSPSGSDQLPGGGVGAAPFCAVLCDEGKGREGDRVRHLLLLSRVGGGIHIAQAVQRDGEGERAGGEKGNKRWRKEGRVGWLRRT